MDWMPKTLGEGFDFSGIQSAWDAFYDSCKTWTPWAGAGEVLTKIVLFRFLWWILIFVLAILQFIWVSLGSVTFILIWMIDGLKGCV